MRIGWSALVLLLFAGASFPQVTTAPGVLTEPLLFRGSCDASAAVALTDDSLVVADDENNTLRVYRFVDRATPSRAFDLSAHLAVEAGHPEADIEGAARAGDRIYWITSHGRNKDGKLRPNRYRLFATQLEIQGDDLSLRPVGRPCLTLVQTLLTTPLGRKLALDEATRFGERLSKKERERLAPKKAGLNIEALAASADGNTLYIGFRNPLLVGPSSKRAIVIPLNNAADVLERSQTPQFGRPLLWDLHDRGLRSMEYCPRRKAFLLIAGGTDEGGDFALYRWSGDPTDPPTLVQTIHVDLPSFKPEALVPFATRDDVLILSDDGSIRVAVTGPSDCIDPVEYDADDRTCEQKYLRDQSRKTFRAIRLPP